MVTLASYDLDVVCHLAGVSLVYVSILPLACLTISTYLITVNSGF